MSDRSVCADETSSRVQAIEADIPAFELTMNEEDFRAFYNRTAAGVRVYLARLTGDRQLADDLLQEAFYRFLRARLIHENEAHRRNSLYRIATNLARDARRRNIVRPWLGPSEGDVDQVPAAADAQTESVTDVNRALALMKPRDRAMLWLAYAEGASHAEIALALGLRPASIKILLFRARRRMASLLRGDK